MDGYSRLSELIGTHPDLAIFRRFSVLNSRNLIFMQGELTHLEAALETIATEDRKSQDPQRADFEYSISTLMGPHTSAHGHEQWDKILEIRGKLKDYSL